MERTKNGSLGRSVSIIGIGATPCGNVAKDEPIKDLTEGELLAAATIEAVEDAGIEIGDIDAYLVGQLGSLATGNVANQAAIYSKWIGMTGKPGISHDECCCTGNYGLQQAVMMVASGAHDIVLNTGVNIDNTFLPLGKLRLPQFYTTTSPFWDDPCAWTNEPSFNHQGKGGMMDGLDEAIVVYAKTHGYSRQDIWDALNSIHVFARRQAVNHPLCLLRTETYEEEAASLGFANPFDYLNDPMFNPRLGTILRAKDCNPMVDGAAAVIVCPTEMAKKICKQPIEVAGFGGANLWQNDFGTRPIKADVAAAKQAYSMAGITDPSREIDVLSLHDCTCGNWLMFSEDVGYFGPGEAQKAAVAGDMAIDGKKPVNITGGRQEFGHPLAPCNIVEMYEIVKQMRGEAGDRQMAVVPKTAAIQGYAGSFSFTVTVLRSL